ncbi:conserved protein, unknown function, partial [Hepatocystis sp. ex Piliocolobus tephrosceles]
NAALVENYSKDNAQDIYYTIEEKLSELKKHLIKEKNFVYMCKQAFLVKWLSLRIFILQKCNYTNYNCMDIFNYIYKTLNSLQNEEFIVSFNISLLPSKTPTSFVTNTDIKYTFYFFLYHIHKKLNFFINKYNKLILCFTQKDGEEENDITICQHQNIITWDEKNKKKLLFDYINVYVFNFITTFFPYLINSRFSYDVFQKLFEIYFTLYLINKNNDNVSVNLPIHLILLIFVHHINWSQYIMLSYFSDLKKYLNSTNLDSLFYQNAMTYELVMSHLRESIHHFILSWNSENMFGDLKVSCDANSLLAFYHMFFYNMC